MNKENVIEKYIDNITYLRDELEREERELLNMFDYYKDIFD